MRFVWLDLPDGNKIPVNPDQVAYLRRNNEGQTSVVFGAFAGGLHQVAVAGSGEKVARQLQQAPDLPPTPLGKLTREDKQRMADAVKTARERLSPEPKEKGPPKRTARKSAKTRA